jgi:hypothetical protein
MTTVGPELPTAPATLEELFTETVPAPLLLLVAGPYRSGTGDDPALLAAHVDDMVTASLELFRRGHVPLTGEALALPLVAAAGSTAVGDAEFDAVFHPYARRLLARCDGVVRIGGPSAGADEMVALARAQGARTWTSVADVPQVAAPGDSGAAS